MDIVINELAINRPLSSDPHLMFPHTGYSQVIFMLPDESFTLALCFVTKIGLSKGSKGLYVLES